MLRTLGMTQTNAMLKSTNERAMVKNQVALVSAERKWKPRKFFSGITAFFRLLTLPSSPCRWLSMPRGPSDFPAIGNSVTGTLFGHRKGHVHLAVQENPRSAPFLLLELATPTSSLVKEMASGLVRIALECEKTANRGKLFQEPVWEMYCNGRKTGYGMKRTCSESDLKILNLVQAVSMGAGVLPNDVDGSEGGELMYMRARFERVVGSKDSEAFYMMNPDGSGPELSIFLLRI